MMRVASEVLRSYAVRFSKLNTLRERLANNEKEFDRSKMAKAFALEEKGEFYD